MNRKDVERLRKLAQRLEAEEARKQERFGDRVKGSTRSADVALAKSIRAVLAELEIATAAFQDDDMNRVYVHQLSDLRQLAKWHLAASAARLSQGMQGEAVAHAHRAVILAVLLEQLGG